MTICQLTLAFLRSPLLIFRNLAVAASDTVRETGAPDALDIFRTDVASSEHRELHLKSGSRLSSHGVGHGTSPTVACKHSYAALSFPFVQMPRWMLGTGRCQSPYVHCVHRSWLIFIWTAGRHAGIAAGCTRRFDGLRFHAT